MKEIGSLNKDIGDIKKNKMEILELKHVTEIKKQWMGSTEEWKIREMEDGMIEIIQSKQQRENRLKKISRASGTCGTLTKDLTIVSSESWKERKKKKRVAWKST